MRKELAAIERAPTKQYNSAELEQLRARRRELEQQPERHADRARRTSRSARCCVVRQYDALSKELSRLEVDLLGMEARITATDHFIGDPAKAQNPGVAGAVRSRARRRRRPRSPTTASR